jgi:hypothetical protein
VAPQFLSFLNQSVINGEIGRHATSQIVDTSQCVSSSVDLCIELCNQCDRRLPGLTTTATAEWWDIPKCKSQGHTRILGSLAAAHLHLYTSLSLVAPACPELRRASCRFLRRIFAGCVSWKLRRETNCP